MIPNEKVILSLASDILLGAMRIGAGVLIIKPETVGYQALIQVPDGLRDHRFKELKRENADAIVAMIENLADARPSRTMIKQGKYKLEDGIKSLSVEIISIPPSLFSGNGERRPTLLIFLEERLGGV